MSLRTTQQIDKLLVGQIFPRDSNQNFISTGQILLTDNQGRANWTSLSSIGGNYAQFTSLSTNEGVIVADQQQTTLNFREGAGINLQIISNALYLNTTAFTAIDIDGGNSLLSSNISNNVINPRLRFVNGNYTKIRGDPGTNSIFIDVDLLSTTRGARAAYTSFIIQNNSSYVQPPATESVILNAIVSDASLTLIGVDDLQVSIANFSPSCNVLYLGLSTITAAKFSTLYTSAFDGLSNLSVSIDLLNSRQINTQGVTCNQFFPVSTQVWRTSTTFSAFYNFTFNPLRDAVTAAVNDTAANYSTLSSYINSQNIYTTGLSNAFTTVSNTAGTNATNITTISNLLNAVSTNVTTVSTGLNTVSNTAATNTSNITTVSNTAGTNATNITTISNLLNAVSTNVTTVSTGLNTVSNTAGTNATNITTISNLLNAVSTNVTTVSTGLNTVSNTAGTNATNITTVSNLVNYLLSVSNYSAVTMSTSYGFFSTISAGTIYARFVGDGSGLTGIATGSGGISIVPPVLSTTFLSTGFLSASNISVITMSTAYGFFSTISAGTIYAKFVGDGSGLTGISGGGGISIVPPVLSTTFLSTGFLSASNISVITMSTAYGFFSTISAGTIYGRFVGDGSGLTGISGGGGISIVPPVLSTTFLSTGFLSASNISVITMSTAYGFFSTISAGTIYGRFAGDASLLTAIPNTGAVLTVSNNVTTVSNLLNSVSTNVTTVSTNLNTVSNLLNSVSTNTTTVSTNLNTLSNNVTTVSNLLNSVSTNVTTVSTNLNTVSNLLNSVSTNVTTVSTNLNTLSNNVTTVSNLLNSVSTNVTTVSTNLNTLSNNVTTISNRTSYLLTVSNYSAITTSTSYGFFSTISAGTVYGRFVGDGSGLTGIASGGISLIPPILSTTLLSTGILTARSISTLVISTNTGFASSFNINRLTTSTITSLLGSFSSISAGQAYISSLTVDSLFIGNDIGFTNMGDIIATSLSTLQVTTGNLNAVNISASRISTSYGFFSTISAGTIYAKFIGDGSGLTGIASGGISIVPPVLSTTFLSTGFLSASNISAITMSTAYGFFSTISAGTIYGRFAGDASLLTSIPNNGAVLSVSNNVTTVSNLLNSVSTNTTNISTNLNTVSNLLNSVSTNATTISTNLNTVSNLLNSVSTNTTNISTNLNTVSNLLNSVSTNVTTVSTNLNTLSNNVITVSNRTNFLLTVSNYSAITTSTSYGLYSTISAGTLYGRFVGDASLLTAIPNNGAVLTISNNVTTVSNLLNAVSTNVTTVSTNVNTVSNLLNSVSTNVTNVSTNLNTLSNNGTTVSNRVNYLLTVSNYSAITTSTSYGFFSTISAGTIYARFIGDGSGLTGIASGGISIVPPVLSTTFLSTGFLSASNISAITMSTAYGFFSTISAGTIYGRFAGDASLLTSIPNTGAVLAVSNNVTTVSNLLNSVSTNVTTVSTNLNTLSNNVTTVSNLLNSVSTNVIIVSTNLNTVSNLLNSVSTNVTTVSTNLNTLSNNVTTVSNITNFLLTISNYSAITTSTSYGFYSTISAGSIYGRFIGDASLLTAIPNNGAVLTVSNNVTTVSNLLNSVSTNVTTISTNLNTVSNLLNSVSTNVTTVSTNLNTVSNLLNSVSTNVTTVSTNLNTVSNLLNSVSTNVTTISTNLNTVSNLLNAVSTNVTTVSNRVNYLLAVSNYSAITTSTSYGFYSTISAGTIFGRFVGDGSGLTGIASGGMSIVPPVLSTTLLSTGILTARNISTLVISTNTGFASSFGINNLTTSTTFGLLGIFSTVSTTQLVVSSLTVNSLMIGGTLGYVNMGDIVTTSLSTLVINAGSIIAQGISTILLSTTYGLFSTISAGTIYGKFVGDGSGLTGVTGSGGISIVPPVLSTTFMSTGFLSASNISAITMSTTYGFFSTISAGTIYGRFAGDGSLLTSIPNNGAVLAVSNNVTTVSNLLNAVSTNVTTVSTNLNTVSNLLNSVSTNVTTVSTNLNTLSNNVTTVSNRVNYLLTVSNYSAITTSTSYGFYSTISAGIIYGRFVGDASLLTAIPNNGAVLAVSNNVTTVSNLLNAVSTNVTTVSTNLNTVSNNVTTVSNLLNAVSTNVTTVSTNLNTVSNNVTTVSNLLNAVSTNVTTVSTNLNTVSNNATTVSNRVNFLLTISNYSAITTSTSYGFYSTISAGTIYGRFVGDASLLTAIPNTGAVLTVSNNVTTVSNLLNAVSTNVTTVSTNLNTVSNSITTISNSVNYLLTVSNTSAITTSTSYGFFSTLSSGNIYGRFIGDASLLTAIPNTGAVLTISNNVTTVSNLLNSVSTNVITVSTNLNTVSNALTTVSNSVNYLLTVSNTSAITTSTSYGFFSTLSSGNIYGRFIGDGSLLTGLTIPNTGAVLTVSNNLTTVSNSVNFLLTVSNTSAITTSTSYGFFSTLSAGSIYSRFIGDGSLLTGLRFSYSSPPVLSTTFMSTGFLSASNVSTITMSTNYGFFSTISAGTIYAKFVGDGSGLTGIASGGISIVPPVLSTTLLSTGILTASNISTAVISTNAGFASSFFINRLTTSTVSALVGSFSTLSVSQVYISSLTVDNLTIGNDNGYINMGDVIAASLSTGTITAANIIAVSISTTRISTSHGFFSTISAGTVYGKFVGDGSGLTGITGSGGMSIVPPVLSTTFLSTGFLSASNVSAITMSTNYGFFSTISTGTVYGRHIGDGSGLTNLPTSSLSLSSGNISISTITLVDTVNNSTGTIFERSSLLYFNAFVIGGASVWQSQLLRAN